ncbi:hypothetical protein KAU55_05490 [Candidatus Bathyarchaeota archaeon]|nr:hypothetical protein [Candidatus Bathyarchaeota archaeon]
MFRKIVSGAFEGLINDFPVLSTVTWNLTLRGIGPPTDTTSLCFDLNGGTYDVRIIGNSARLCRRYKL